MSMLNYCVSMNDQVRVQKVKLDSYSDTHTVYRCYVEKYYVIYTIKSFDRGSFIYFVTMYLTVA